MPEIQLKKRYKSAGDVFNALLAVGFDPETASSFLNDINDADVVEVVRCKECKNGIPINDDTVMCRIIWDYRTNEFFCKSWEKEGAHD